jgi:hypothetical protein
MTSWYSQLLTTTTSRISTLRSTLLATDADGDTEDDTHVCRVLRAYYTEKGRQFPPWLPPDPKAPPPPPPVFAQSQSQVGSRYGGLVQGGAGAGGGMQGQGAGGGGGLSSLWDRNPVGTKQDPASLRQARGAPPPMRGADPSRNPFSNNRGSGGSLQPDPRDEIQARPLPSQRAGSYQQTSNAYGAGSRLSGGGTPPGSSAGGGSAQDRLKQRLWGGARSASPAQSTAYQPPPPQQSSASSRYGQIGGGSGGGGGGGNYEDRFAPGGMYDAGQGQGQGQGGGGGRSGGSKPFMAANAPWASNETDYSGGGGAGSGGVRSGGLPGRPGARGLPSGPRMR